MYKIFIPNIVNSFIPKKGMGIVGGNNPADTEKLNSHYFYDWNVNSAFINNPYYTPMLKWGAISTNIPKNYSSFILFLNEPNNVVQANKTPLESFELYKRARDYYSKSTMVVGGMNSLSEIHRWTMWLEDFLAILYKNNEKFPRFHLHGYIESFVDHPEYNVSIDMVITLWKQQIFLIGDSNVWVTEYSNATGNIDDFKKLTEFCMSNSKIERFYPFANRIDSTAWYYPQNWSVNPQMISSDGKFTEFGNYYKGVSEGMFI